MKSCYVQGEGWALEDLTLEEFRTWPLLKEGESKEIRRAPGMDESICVIWLKPTIYSFTQNRTEWVKGSNLLRARMMKSLLPVLAKACVPHAYIDVHPHSGFVYSRWVPPALDPNVEVIVKRYNSGTSWHRYYGLDQKPARPDHPFWPGNTVPKDGPLPGPRVRFDWRNPFFNPRHVEAMVQEYPLLRGVPCCDWPATERFAVMMRDEVLPEETANDLIDTARARKTAILTYNALQQHLATHSIVIYDMCLFITADGGMVYGEISQDCGRFRHLDLGSLDKDVWRSGGSSADVLKKWHMIVEILER